MRELTKTYKSTYCRFLKSHYHNINECIHLKDATEEMVIKRRHIEYTQEEVQIDVQDQKERSHGGEMSYYGKIILFPRESIHRESY